jgi:hypothetical protein
MMLHSARESKAHRSSSRCVRIITGDAGSLRETKADHTAAEWQAALEREL